MNFILYHANCDDGFGAAWTMWRKFGPSRDTVYVPVNYGEVPPLEHIKSTDRVWVVDFSYPKDDLLEIGKRAAQVTLYDHHRSAFQQLADVKDPSPIERFADQWGNIQIVLANDKSGAGLTWEQEFPHDSPPALINYIEDNDLWALTLPQTRAFKHYLRTFDYDFSIWDGICETMEHALESFLEKGVPIERAFNKYVKYMADHAYWAVLKNHPEIPPFLAASSHHAFSSDLGHILAQRSGTFGLCYYDKGYSTYCSLRADNVVDVSAVAKLFGGGGHRNASGFECKMEERPWTSEQRA